MDKDFNRTFDCCPNCGSDLRFLEQLELEVKERGLARPEWRARYEVRQGVIMDSDRTIMLPIGVKLPGYYITTDICMDCGTLYATELRRLEAQTKAMPTGGLTPDLGNIRRN